MVTYYEKYSNDGVLINTIKDECALRTYTIMDAGYGLLVPSEVYTNNSTATLLMGVGTNIQRASMACDGSWMTDVLLNGVETECVLYSMTQNSYPFGHAGIEDEGGIQPSHTNTPAAIKAKFSTGLLSKLMATAYRIMHVVYMIKPPYLRPHTIFEPLYRCVT